MTEKQLTMRDFIRGIAKKADRELGVTESLKEVAADIAAELTEDTENAPPAKGENRPGVVDTEGEAV